MLIERRYEVDDRVTVDRPGHLLHELEGTVVKVGPVRYSVQIDEFVGVGLSNGVRILAGFELLPAGTKGGSDTPPPSRSTARTSPASGDHGTCTRCGGEIWYWEATAWNGVEEEVLDAGWSHLNHPADGHDAVLGGPA